MVKKANEQVWIGETELDDHHIATLSNALVHYMREPISRDEYKQASSMLDDVLETMRTYERRQRRLVEANEKITRRAAVARYKPPSLVSIAERRSVLAWLRVVRPEYKVGAWTRAVQHDVAICQSPDFLSFAKEYRWAFTTNSYGRQAIAIPGGQQAEHVRAWLDYDQHTVYRALVLGESREAACNACRRLDDDQASISAI